MRVGTHAFTGVILGPDLVVTAGHLDHGASITVEDGAYRFAATVRAAADGVVVLAVEGLSAAPLPSDRSDRARGKRRVLGVSPLLPLPQAVDTSPALPSWCAGGLVFDDHSGATAFLTASDLASALPLVELQRRLALAGISVSFDKVPPARRAPELERVLQFDQFEPILDDRLRVFVGREHLLRQVGDALRAPKRESGYILIEGDPGIGKTALASWLVRALRMPHHFNHRKGGPTTASAFLTSLCAQLVLHYDLKRDHLPANAASGPAVALELLREAAALSDRPVLVLIDALDEADDVDGAYALMLPMALPKNVFFIVTSRRNWQTRLPEASLVAQITVPRSGPEVEADLRKLIALRLPLATETQATELVRRAAGNFLYLGLMLAALERREPGEYLAGLDELPDSLEDYYAGHWDRMVVQAGTRRPLFESVLGVLATNTAPLSIDDLLYMTSGWSRREIRDVTLGWAEFLDREDGPQKTSYMLYHPSFRAFLARKLSFDEVRRQTGLALEQAAHGASFPPPPRHALLVGIAHYKTIDPLPTAVHNDVDGIAKILTERDYTLHVLKDVTKTALLEGLRWLEQESQGGGNSLLYFSGHGASSGHLLLVDFAHGREADAALSAQELTLWIRRLHSERTLMVLDACHAGMAELKDGAAERKGAPDGFDLKAIEAVMGQGRAIFAASQPAQPSVILRDARNSLFTGYLIDGLGGAANKHIGRRVEDAVGVLGLATFLGDQNYHGLQRPLFKVEVDRNFEIVPAKRCPPGLRSGPAAP